MAKKVLELDTPFRTGERVATTRDLIGAPEGTLGKIRLSNGLSGSGGGKPWIRYWVRFEDGKLLGQVDHNDLVRPAQAFEWQERKVAQEAARDAEDESKAGPSSEGGSTASAIPAALLARSKAAKTKRTETDDTPEPKTQTTPAIPAALLARSKAAKAKRTDG